MTDKNHKQADWRGAENDELDRELNTALAKYAAVEPRAGLETRVLANLRAEPARVPERAWWYWGVAAALAAMMVMAVALAWRSAKPSQVVREHRALPASQGSKEPTQVVAQDDTSARMHTPVSMRNITVHRARPKIAVATAPKLDQFPSPRPLSEQEIILANYVAQFHAQAALIARVANEEMQRDRLEMMEPSQSFAGPGNQEPTNR